MQFNSLMWFFITCLVSQVGCSETLSTKIDTIIEQQLPHATVGILVQDAQTGQVIYSKNANKLLSAASGTKLFTAAAALYQLKSNYSFLTTLSQKKQDFYITFSGSPSLTSNNLNKFLQKLKENGIKRIKGNIILDNSRFKPPYYAGGNSYDDLGWYYAAPSNTVILNGNALSYEFISAKEMGMPIHIQPKTPDDAGLTIINQVVTVTNEQEKNCNLNIEIRPRNTLKLYGCLAEDNKPQVMKLAITDPVLYAKQVIKNALNKNDILLSGQIISGKTPDDARVITGFRSKNLVQLLTHMLQESDNLYADSLYKQLAYAVTGEGTYKQGTFAIKKILAQHTNIDWEQVELRDGAGLRYNLVTAEQVVVLLSDLYNDKSMQFFKILPQAGVSGSLKNRMQRTTLEKKVFAKTGTMHDISSLSGYIISPNNKTLIFSIIINGINKPISTARSLEDKILLIVSDENNWNP